MKQEAKELLEAIESNIEDINVGLPNGRDHYVPMVRLEHIATEIDELESKLPTMLCVRCGREPLDGEGFTAFDNETTEIYLCTDCLMETAD